MKPLGDVICGVGSQSGPNGEMLCCGFPPGHDGKHSWATLPTFVDGHIADEQSPVAEFVQWIESSTDFILLYGPSLEHYDRGDTIVTFQGLPVTPQEWAEAFRTRER